MNVMRRLKSIASGRTSVSSDPGGDLGTKRAKFDLEIDRATDGESHIVERNSTSLQQHMATTSMEAATRTSNQSSVARTEKLGYDQLPKEMHEMRIRDEKTSNDEKDMEAAVVSGNGTEAGQIIATTVGGHNGQPKQVTLLLFSGLLHYPGSCLFVNSFISS
uniref:Uncharacterized protein n=1 Tax=Rhizophora mucronata TaxID=61149 RepID=A0A2P2M3Z1_RHIMU